MPVLAFAIAFIVALLALGCWAGFSLLFGFPIPTDHQQLGLLMLVTIVLGVALFFLFLWTDAH